MRILNGLHIDHVAVEFEGEEWADNPGKGFPKYPCTRVVHIDDVPKEIIDNYIREYSN